MINPVQTSITGSDGSDRDLIIAPVLVIEGEYGLRSTGAYKLYKLQLGDETTLITKPFQLETAPASLTENQNPDYLGELQITPAGSFHYNSDHLDSSEIEDLVSFITSYQEPEL